jgi:hypothetical protein
MKYKDMSEWDVGESESERSHDLIGRRTKVRSTQTEETLLLFQHVTAMKHDS